MFKQNNFPSCTTMGGFLPIQKIRLNHLILEQSREDVLTTWLPNDTMYTDLSLIIPPS